jgi:peptide/nickel transport system ATP-binding protein
VGLDHLDVTCLPGELSVGQCQRAAIVRALIAKPSLVIADEPTASLDVTTAAGITRLLRRAADDRTALVVVSHDRERLDLLADRVLHLHGGWLREGRDMSDTASQVSRTAAGGTETSRSNPPT